MLRRLGRTRFWWAVLGVLPFSLCQGCVFVTPMPAHTQQWCVRRGGKRKARPRFHRSRKDRPR